MTKGVLAMKIRKKGIQLIKVFEDAKEKEVLLAMDPKYYQRYMSYISVVKNPIAPSIWLNRSQMQHNYKSFYQISKELNLSTEEVIQAYISGMKKIRIYLKNKGLKNEDLQA